MSTPREVTAPNGDVFQIKAYSSGVMRKALEVLKRGGTKITVSDSDLLSGLLFQAATAKEIIITWHKLVDNELKAQGAKEINDLIDERPKVVNWLVKKSQELSEDQDKEFAEDSKN